LKKQQKRESSRWLMLKRQNEMNEAEEAARPAKLKLVDHDEHVYVLSRKGFYFIANYYCN
jgi:hypothetical protein